MTLPQMLLLALIFYLKYEAPEEEQNFAMVMETICAGEVDEEAGGIIITFTKEILNMIVGSEPRYLESGVI